MTGVRDLIRNPRVAAAIALVAVLFVVYRVYQGWSGPGSDASSTTDPGTDAKAVPAAGVAPGMKASRSRGDARRWEGTASGNVTSRGLVPEVTWSWDRNPFLDTGKMELPHSAIPSVLIDSLSGGGAREPGSSDSRMGLRGTVVSEGKGLAIFGDRVIAEGGTVGEWTVAKVEPYRVVVRRGTESRTLETFRPLLLERRGGKGETP